MRNEVLVSSGAGVNEVQGIRECAGKVLMVARQWSFRNDSATLGLALHLTLFAPNWTQVVRSALKEDCETYSRILYCNS